MRWIWLAMVPDVPIQALKDDGGLSIPYEGQVEWEH